MGRYYNDYWPGNFPNQQLLNEAIDPKKQSCLLQTDDANPLTVRLLVAAEAIERLKELIDRESKQKIQSAVTTLQQTWGMDGWPDDLNWDAEPRFYTTGSGIACPEPFLRDQYGRFQTARLPQGFNYQNNRIVFSDGQAQAFPLIEAHIAIYNFFNNYGSALDRFAGELNRLYDLQVDSYRIDWGYLARSLESLTNKHSAVANKINLYHQNVATRSLRYRNRLIHDGLISLKAVITGSNKWEIRTIDDPDDPNSPINTNALVLCQDTLSSLIGNLNTCYGLILERLRIVGQPPW